MNCIFESFQLCEVLTSDGNYTIGYVDGKPAEWEGNMTNLKPGDLYCECQGHEDFNNGNEIYIINNCQWEKDIK